MKPMSMEYSAVATTVADDCEADGVFPATPIPIKLDKVGHSLFGFCCDTRRGTMILCIIMIASSIMSIATKGLGIFAMKAMNGTFASISDALNGTSGTIEKDMVSSGDSGENDSLMTSVMQQGTNDAVYAIQVSMAVSFLSLLCWCLSIYGAKFFQIWPVAINIALLLVQFLFTSGALFGFVVTSLLMYPQIMFVVEVQKGIMSSMTYTNEAQSCCCVAHANKNKK